MNAVALHRSRWGRARDRLACVLIVLGITLPGTAVAQALNMINGDVTQKVALSDLRAMSDATFTLYDPFQGRDVENLREFNDWIWMIRSIEAKW